MIHPRSNILKIKTYIPGKPIDKLRCEFGIDGDIYKYNSNENALGPSPRAIDALKDILCECHLYPDDSQCNLKEKLSAQFGVSENQIVVGNGSVELILMAGLVYLCPEDSIVITSVSFIMPKIVARIIGCKIKFVPHLNYAHDLEAMLAAIDETTKMVYLDNPINPTGTRVEKAELDDFIRRVPEHVLVIVDEAYYEYALDDDYPDSAGYISEGRNVLTLRTFSKIHGLAGLRVGYGASNKEVADCLMKVRPPFNVNRLAHVSACVAMDDLEHIEKSKKVNEAGKSQLYSEFDKLGLDYIPSWGNFILVHFERDAVDVFTRLQAKGLVTRTCLEYRLLKSLRITVADEERNEKLVLGLREVL